MKHLLSLFSIILLAYSVVSSQEKPKEKLPVGHGTVSSPILSEETTKVGNASVADAGFPAVSDLIMNMPLVKRDGTAVTIGAYRGNVVLLHLWATWADPVTVTTPTLSELDKKYKDAGLRIIGLNVGNGNGSKEKRREITQFMKKFKINYDLVEEVSFGTMTDAINKLTRFKGIPQLLLIDREGKLRAVALGGGEAVIRVTKDQVERLMKEKHVITQ